MSRSPGLLSTLVDGGGVDALAASREQVAAFHGDNYLPFLDRHYRASRSALFDLLDVLGPGGTSTPCSAPTRWSTGG